MKKNYLLWLISIVMSMTYFTSCTDPDNGDEPDTGDDTEIKPTDVVPDPEGTITTNFIANGEEVNWGVFKIAINEALNFTDETYYSDIEFNSIGEVNGLGNIVSIPKKGWGKEVAVMPKYGYIARYGEYNQYVYARFFVVDWITSTTGGILGAIVKYQAPFEPKISFEKNSVELSAAGDFVNIEMDEISTYSVISKPEWCKTEYRHTGIMIGAEENIVAEKRIGKVVVKNATNEFTFTVTQAPSENPIFQSGDGTEEYPYVIKTPGQFVNILSGLYNGHFVLEQDIDVSGYTWNNGGDFNGTLDGRNHKITGLPLRLFYRNNGTIKGLRIEIAPEGINYQDNMSTICYYNNGLISETSVKGLIYCSGYYTSSGITVYNANKITNCYTDVELYAGSVAGIAIYDYSGGTIENCYSNITTSEDCFVYGIGGSGQTINNCYVTGTFSGTPIGSYICSNCYYNNETITSNLEINGVTGLSDNEMKLQSSYKMWDFTNVWEINEGISYPTLRCFNK